MARWLGRVFQSPEVGLLSANLTIKVASAISRSKRCVSHSVTTAVRLEQARMALLKRDE